MFQAFRKYIQKDKVDEEAYAWHTQNRLTPDVWKLQQYMRQLIFVPDDMMRGQRNHEMIAEASASGDDPFHPSCYTLKPFTFWKKDLGTMSYPIAMEESFCPSSFVRWPPPPARIKGELYAIRPYQFIKLDKYKQNGIQFERKRVMITLPYRNVIFDRKHPVPEITIEYIETVQAWMYVGIPEYWDHQLGGVFQTSTMNLFEHDTARDWIKEFYKFE